MHDPGGRTGVETCNRLVGDDQPWLLGERARDRDPLLLPAGERVGALERVIEHADTLQAFERPELVRALEAAEYAAPGR